MRKRIKLKDRILPNYSKGEEIFNMVSHIVGGVLGVVALVLCVIFAAKEADALTVVGCAIYGASLIILYTMSSLYHGLRDGMPKRVLQVLDHCTIYLLIAGTYTPVLFGAMHRKYPVLSWVIFGIVWGCAIIAGSLTAIDLKKFEKFSLVCYVVMGWVIVFFIKQTYDSVGTGGLVFLITGGIAYTLGSVLYAVGKKCEIPYVHSVFHLFVLAGSILQFFAILFYAI